MITTRPLILSIPTGVRISACFLYTFIYKRLDSARREYTRLKFEKLVKDDTPMVRRGAA